MRLSRKFIGVLALTAAAATLSACGGSGVEATVGGSVVGLSGGTSVVVLNNGTDPVTVGANGTFTFDQQINSGSGYSVTVQTQPIGETCTVTNGSGTVDSEGDDVTNIVVSCFATGT